MTAANKLPNLFIDWMKQLGIALLYLLSGYVINHHFTNHNIVCTVWPGSGLALGSLLIGGRRYIWGVALGALLLNLLSNDSFLAAGGITLAIVLEALLGAWLLTRDDRSALPLDTLRDYLRLITLGGGVAGIAGAIIGGLSLLLAGYITPADYYRSVLHWWMGDALGVILVTPFILVWWTEKCRSFNVKQRLEGLLLVGMSFLVGQIVFLDWFREDLSDTPKGYMMFFCVTWVAMRMGTRGVTFVVLMIATQAMIGAHLKIGFFAHEIARANLHNYWFFFLILSVVGMALATYVNEIKQALSALQLKDSALNAAANGIVITDANGRIEWANQAFSRITGFSLSDAYGLNPRELVNSGLQDDAYYQSMWETILANKVWQGELVNCRRDGSLYNEEMTITPLTNDQGEITHFVAVKQEITKRKQAEEALRESENKLAAILDSVEAFIYIKDCNYQYQYANQPTRQVLGKSLEDIIGKLDDVFFDEATTAKLRENDRRVLELGERITAENIYIHKNNAITRTYLTVKQPLRREDGSIYGLCGISTDISERKRMEENLRDSDAFNVSVLNSLTSHIAVLDARGVIVAANNAWQQFAAENGLSESSHQVMLGINYLDACKNAFNQAYADEANAAHDGVMAVLSGEHETFQLEYPCHSPNQQRWFQMHVLPLQGLRRGVVVSHENITKRKQAQETIAQLNKKLEDKLRTQDSILTETNLVLTKKVGELYRSKNQLMERETKLNAIFNAALEGIITIDSSGIIVSANSAVETIFGYKPEELVSCSMHTLMWLPQKEMNEFRLSSTVKNDAKIWEIEGINKQGSVVPLDVSIAEFSIENAHYFTYIVRDVSLRKRQELQDKEHLDALAHVTRLGLMGEMASGFAHEVNQPLAAISTYTQVSLNLISTEKPDLVKLSEVLTKTQQESLRAGKIIHRMREFIKSHAKQSSITDINVLIHDTVDLCLSEIKQNSIRLTVKLENNLPPVYVDQIQIQQVIINLIRNSVDALVNFPTEKHPHLTIHSHLTLNNVIRVRIKDNGPGLDEDQKEKILMPFYTTKANGMGMGLSISRSLIEAHEGTLLFNSLPGKGTTFYFTLPIQEK
ncbi:MAG: PAS domain S-box protein [Methylobacter sp.]|nr:PAS domain S-box protein [Methylobacter sp.]